MCINGRTKEKGACKARPMCTVLLHGMREEYGSCATHGVAANKKRHGGKDGLCRLWHCHVPRRCVSIAAGSRHFRLRL
jgi:hypothetical protein